MIDGSSPRFSPSWRLRSDARSPRAPKGTAAGDPAVRRLLLRNVTIISLEREAPLGPVDVSIQDGRIAEVAEKLPTSGLAADQMLDGTGKFLLPGLIDSHVHLSTIPGMHGGHEAQFPGIAKAAREQIPLSYLYHGFTSVVDLISSAGFAQTWNAREARPHLYYSGAAPIMDGYPTQFIPAPVRYRSVDLGQPRRARAHRSDQGGAG